MNTIFKLSLIALMGIACSALSAHTWHGALYKCPGDKPGIIYQGWENVPDSCKDKAYKVSYHKQHHRYYRVDDNGNYYYDDDRGIVGGAVEGAHDVASGFWHGIFG